MPRYGSQIGHKFHPDGAPAYYPGNTVIADVPAGSPAADALRRMRAAIADLGYADNFIPLPPDSDHMTVMRGLNDAVRDPAYWPSALPADADMAEADAYVARAVRSVPAPQSIRMCFDTVTLTDEDLRARLRPADDAQAQVLRRYRDNLAEALGLYLPHHADYTFHITLAYTRIVPASPDRLLDQLRAIAATAPPLALAAPHIAYYKDMLAFSKEPIERGCAV